MLLAGAYEGQTGENPDCSKMSPLEPGSMVTTLSMSDEGSSGGCRVLKSRPASPKCILGHKTFRCGKETGGWQGDRRGVDEVLS